MGGFSCFMADYVVLFLLGEVMNKIRLIGIDLDGTALNASKQLTEHNKEVFSLCAEKGIYIVPVTGRPYSGLYDEYKRGMKCDYSINTNGAAAMEIKSGRRVISHTMNSEKSIELMDILSEYNCYYGVFFDGYGYLTEKNLKGELEKYKNTPLYKYILKTRRPVGDQKDFIRAAGSCDNIYVIAENSDVRDEICRNIKDIDDIFFTCSDYNDVEIGGNCSKGETLIELAVSMGISPDEVMAIGDGGNDVNMLKLAGLSVAMENACAEAKEISDFITKSCEESGVAYAIEKFVL